MKKNKILFPIIGLVASTAAIAPVVSLTSCSKGNKVEEPTHFTFTSDPTTKSVTVEYPKIVGQSTYEFVTSETLTEQDIKNISTTVELTQTNSNITILRCWKEKFDTSTKTLTIQISYSINPAAFSAEQDSVAKYDIRIEGGTWYQTEKGFSITAKKAA